MKKISILLCCLLMSSLALAKSSGQKDLRGTWKEVTRTQSGKRMLIVDTLLIKFVSSNQCFWGKPSSSSPLLRYKQVGSTLQIGSAEFEILAQEEDWMKLSTDEGLEIELSRYTAQKATIGNQAMPKSQKKLAKPTIPDYFKPAAPPKMGTVPEKIEPFVGQWKCYKRTSIKPISKEQQYRLVRLVSVEETADAIIAKIYGFGDFTNVASWIVQRYEKGILYTAGKDERAFKVINCQPNELVIENEGVSYYMTKI